MERCTKKQIAFGDAVSNSHTITLPETNSLHLKMDGWNTIVSFWEGLFSGDGFVGSSRCATAFGVPVFFTPSSFLGLETASGRCDCNNQSREPTKVSTESRRMKGDEALRKTLNCRKIPCGHETVQQTK